MHLLERAVRHLRLSNVRVVCERLEEHARKGEPLYDAVFIRAVADALDVPMPAL